jgi:hypothetical protein
MDAGPEQFLDVLVTAGVAAAGGIGVGQLIDKDNGGPAPQHGVEVHLFQHHAVILDAPPRHLLQVADLGGRLGPAMRFHDADDHIDALPFEAVGFLQHQVRFAHAGGEAEVDLEPAALLLADQR